MDRKTYIEMCQRCAVLPEGALGIKRNVPCELLVRYDGATYYPVAYKLSFTRKGEPIHTAILHELNANAEIHAEVGKVMEYDAKRSNCNDKAE